MKMKVFLIFCVTAFLLGAVDVAQSAPVFNPANHHWYFLTEPGTWPEAEAQAVAAGGHLVTINDAAENAWVTAMFHPVNTPGGPWIGFYQLPGSPEPTGVGFGYPANRSLIPIGDLGSLIILMGWKNMPS
jgi:hypothetical protein